MNYTYIDKYGFRHAVEGKETALEFAKKDTPVFEFTGDVENGYIVKVVEEQKFRARFPEDVPFGNEHPTKDVVLTEEEVMESLGSLVGYGKQEVE